MFTGADTSLIFDILLRKIGDTFPMYDHDDNIQQDDAKLFLDTILDCLLTDFDTVVPKHDDRFQPLYHPCREYPDASTRRGHLQSHINATQAFQHSYLRQSFQSYIEVFKASTTTPCKWISIQSYTFLPVPLPLDTEHVDLPTVFIHQYVNRTIKTHCDCNIGCTVRITVSLAHSIFAMFTVNAYLF
jgi:hypothetical protein